VPLSPYLSDGHFDPETVSLLGTAFNHAWREVEARNGFLTDEQAANLARQTLATHIIAAAKEGERDVNRLVDNAIGALFGPSNKGT
jgi:hypothetical protein